MTRQIVDLPEVINSSEQDYLIVAKKQLEDDSSYTTSKVKLGNILEGVLPQQLPPSKGGLGVNFLPKNNLVVGNEVSPVDFISPGPVGNYLQSNGIKFISAPPPFGLNGVASSSQPGLIKTDITEPEPFVYTKTSIDNLLLKVSEDLNKVNISLLNKQDFEPILSLNKGGTGTSSLTQNTLLQVNNVANALQAYTLPNNIPLFLQDGWTNLGGDYTTASFRKNGVHQVEVKGVIFRGMGAPFVGAVISNLQEGYRPLQKRAFITASNGGFCLLELHPDGNIIFKSASDVSFVSLEFTFTAEQ